MKLVAVLEKFGINEKIEALIAKHPERAGPDSSVALGSPGSYSWGPNAYNARRLRAELEKFEFMIDPLETKVAGRVHLGGSKRLVRLNYKLMAKEKVADFKATLIHETAHIVAFNMFEERGHGKYFKYVDRQLGGSGDRCHQMEYLTGKATWRYQCVCCGKQYHAARMLRNITNRYCSKCGVGVGKLEVYKLDQMTESYVKLAPNEILVLPRQRRRRKSWF